MKQKSAFALHKPHPEAPTRLDDGDLRQGLDGVDGRGKPLVQGVGNAGLDHDGTPRSCHGQQAQLRVEEGLGEHEAQDHGRGRLLGVDQVGAGKTEDGKAHGDE